MFDNSPLLLESYNFYSSINVVEMLISKQYFCKIITREFQNTQLKGYVHRKDTTVSVNNY